MAIGDTPGCLPNSHGRLPPECFSMPPSAPTTHRAPHVPRSRPPDCHSGSRPPVTGSRTVIKASETVCGGASGEVRQMRTGQRSASLSPVGCCGVAHSGSPTSGFGPAPPQFSQAHEAKAVNGWLGGSCDVSEYQPVTAQKEALVTRFMNVPGQGAEYGPESPTAEPHQDQAARE